MIRNNILLFCFCFLITVTVPSFSNGLIVKSPDQNISFNLKLVPKSNGLNEVFYSVTYKQKEVIEEFSLGLKLKQADINEFKTFELISQERHDSSWTPLYGERSNIIDRFNSSEIQLVSRSGKVLNLEVRAYSEGLAFRYYFPLKNSYDDFDLLEEETTFKLPEEVSINSESKFNFNLKASGGIAIYIYPNANGKRQ